MLANANVALSTVVKYLAILENTFRFGEMSEFFLVGPIWFYEE